MEQQKTITAIRLKQMKNTQCIYILCLCFTWDALFVRQFPFLLWEHGHFWRVADGLDDKSNERRSLNIPNVQFTTLCDNNELKEVDEPKP